MALRTCRVPKKSPTKSLLRHHLLQNVVYAYLLPLRELLAVVLLLQHPLNQLFPALQVRRARPLVDKVVQNQIRLHLFHVVLVLLHVRLGLVFRLLWGRLWRLSELFPDRLVSAR